MSSLQVTSAALLVLAVACSATNPHGEISPKRCNGMNNNCELDMSALGDIRASPPDEITTQLTNNGRRRTFKKQAGTSGDVWVGMDGDSSINLFKTAEGDTVGSLVDAEGKKVCSINTDHLGQTTSTCRNVDEYPQEAHPRPLRVGVRADKAGTDAVSGIRRQTTVVTMDVMVVWTKYAECRTSGLARGCTLTSTTTTAMRNLIDTAVRETNVAYSASGINAQLNLVHAYLDPNYVETSNAFDDALNQITSTTDGIMDDVHTMRTNVGADLVAMIIDDSAYCGLAWMGPSKGYMFSVTAWNCATGYFSFGHEIGHNLGCNHDRGTSNACTSTSSNYGYRDPAASFRTILSYNCAAGQCDNNAGGGCTRIQRFSTSNTALLYNGKALGNSQNDNAQKINSVVATVAAYYATKSACVSNADCNDGKMCTDDTCSSGVCVFTPKNCNDGNACTDDTCNSATGTCSNTPKNCDDGDSCTIDSCDATGVCLHTPKVCPDDGNLCTTEQCVAGSCQSTPKTCNDNNACTQDSCNAATGTCTYATKTCNDNNMCTLDSCALDGSCLFTPKNCDDNNSCTQDSCDASTGACINTPIVGCVCNNNGLCETEETKDNCASDCGTQSQNMALNGNGICEMGDGESCKNSKDCAGSTKLKFCCGLDAACSDSRCGVQGVSCFNVGTQNLLSTYCGDGKCLLGEDSTNCARDCPITCGNGQCDAGETCTSCPGDCKAKCGNGICEIGDGETCSTCPTDCNKATVGRSVYCCGTNIGCSDSRCTNGKQCKSSSVCSLADLNRAMGSNVLDETAAGDASVAAGDAALLTPQSSYDVSHEAVTKANTALLVAVAAAAGVGILTIFVCVVLLVKTRWYARAGNDLEGNRRANQKMEMLLATEGAYTVESSMQMHNDVWMDFNSDVVIVPGKYKKSPFSVPPLDTVNVEEPLNVHDHMLSTPRNSHDGPIKSPTGISLSRQSSSNFNKRKGGTTPHGSCTLQET